MREGNRVDSVIRDCVFIFFFFQFFFFYSWWGRKKYGMEKNMGRKRSHVIGHEICVIFDGIKINVEFKQNSDREIAHRIG